MLGRKILLGLIILLCVVLTTTMAFAANVYFEAYDALAENKNYTLGEATFGGQLSGENTLILSAYLWADGDQNLSSLNLTIYNLGSFSNDTLANLTQTNSSGIFITYDNDTNTNTVDPIVTLLGAPTWNSTSDGIKYHINFTFDNTTNPINLSKSKPASPNLEIRFNISDTLANVDSALFAVGFDSAATFGTSGNTSINFNSSLNSSYVKMDTYAANFSTAYTRDADKSGGVDSLVVTFNEPIDDTNLANGCFGVNGTSSTVSVETGETANDSIVFLNFTNNIQFTNATPQYNYTNNNSCNLTDFAGNPIGIQTNTSADGALPAFMYASTYDIDGDGAVDYINITLSEALTVGNVSSSAFTGNVSLGQDTTHGKNTFEIESASIMNSTVRLVLNDSYAIGTGAILLSYSPGDINDTYGNLTLANGSIRVEDNMSAVLLTAKTYDRDSNGNLDSIALNYSEGIGKYVFGTATAALNSSANITLNLVGSEAFTYDTDNNYDGVNDSVIYLNFTGADYLTDATPLVNVTVNTTTSNNIYLTDLAGVNVTNTINNQSVDRAGPAFLVSTSYDTDGDGALNYINITMSEFLTAGNHSTGVFDIANVSIGQDTTKGLVTLTIGSVVTINDQINIAFDDTVFGTGAVTLSYTGTTVNDSSGNTNTAPVNATITTVDSAAAVLLNAYTLDRSRNGYVDGVRLNFSEGIGNNTWGTATAALNASANISIGIETLSFDPDADYDGVNDSVIYLNFTGTTYLSNETPVVNISVNKTTNNVYLADLAGNNISYSINNATIDKAVPSIWIKQTLDYTRSGYVESINITFSEQMNDSTCDAANFSIEGVSDYTLRTITANDNYFHLVISTTLDTNETLTANYTIGGTENCRDLAQNVLATNNSAVKAPDMAYPQIRYAVASDNSNQVQGIDEDDTLVLSFSEPVNLTGALSVVPSTVGPVLNNSLIFFTNTPLKIFDIANASFNALNTSLTIYFNSTRSTIADGDVLFGNMSIQDLNGNLGIADNKTNVSITGTFFTQSPSGTSPGGGGPSDDPEDPEEVEEDTSSDLDALLASWEAAGTGDESTPTTSGGSSTDDDEQELGAEGAGTEEGVESGAGAGDVTGEGTSEENLVGKGSSKLMAGKTSKIIAVIVILLLIVGLVALLQSKKFKTL
jgi:hypothetical protein